MSDFDAAPNGAGSSGHGRRVSPQRLPEPDAGPRKLADPIQVLIRFLVDHAAGPGYTPRGFSSARMQAARLTPDQARALKLLRVNLCEQHCRMANGRHVESDADALRWLLEQIAEQLREQSDLETLAPRAA